MAYRHILMATGGSEHSLKAEAEARRFAKALGSDLIVLGRRKLSLVQAVLGSVSDYVMRHAPKSTLIVQPS